MYCDVVLAAKYGCSNDNAFVEREIGGIDCDDVLQDCG